jgi:Xaa-Pro dipeptidase
MPKLSLEKMRKDIASYLEKAGADALIGTAPENVYYSSRAYIHTMQSIRLRYGIVLFPKTEPPVFIVQKHEERLARAQSWIEDVRVYPGIEFAGAPGIKLLAEAMHDRRITKGKVLIDKSYICTYYFEELARLFPNIVFQDGSYVFNRLRMVKADDEIELLQKGALATEKAILQTYESAKPQDVEKDISDTMISNLLHNGADLLAGMTWAAGREMTLMNHTKAGSKKIVPGDIIRVDIGGWFKGYRSDLVRMAVVGKPSPKQDKVYKDLVDIHRKVREKLTPGKRCCDIFAYGKSLFEKANYQVSLSLLGHSVGTECHEWPMITKEEEEPLQAGMVFCIEPFLAVEEVGGFHIEDLMLVTENKPKLLSTATSIDEMSIIQ